jgi:type IV pilus assembly protein PilA
MKGAIILLLVIIAAGVCYLAFTEMRQQSAIDEYQIKISQSRVADGLRVAGGARAAIQEYYSDFGKFPESFNEAGVSIGTTSLPMGVTGIVYGGNGVIAIMYSPSQLGLPKKISSADILLQPDPTESGSLNWTCTASVPFANYKNIVPAACRY